MLAILDYKAGNQTSVARALNFLNIPCKITDKRHDIKKASGIIFPGVGAAGQAMRQLSATGMVDVLKEAIAHKTPLLGICLGCQIMLDYCTENDTQTLGIVSGKCLPFDPNCPVFPGQEEKIRVPHMGWNSLTIKKPCVLFENIDQDAQFYFVHGYYPVPASDYIIATTDYGQKFCSVYGKDALWAVQFHPEKSGRPGLSLLRNFYDYCVEGKNA